MSVSRYLLPSLFIAVFGALFPAAAAAQTSVVRYVDGRWWTGDGFDAGSRCVADGLFVGCPATPIDRVVDLAGGHVIPPLADAHNHVTSDTERAIRAGVFYMMNPTLLASVAPSPEQRRPAPGQVDVLYAMGAITAPGGHPEALYQDILGPMFYKAKAPADFLGDAYHHVSTAADIAPVLDRLVAQDADFVKIVVAYSEAFDLRRDDPAFRGQRGLDPALVPQIVKEAHRRGLRVAAHIETAADFRVIVAAGVDVAVHMPGYYGAPLSVDRYLITDEDAAAAALSGIRVVATAAYALTNPDATALPAIQAMQAENLRRLIGADVPILIGTDALSDAAATEARYLVTLGVLTPREALKTLTETTPRFIFPDRSIGRLAVGHEASFLVLDRDPSRDLEGLSESIVRRVKQGAEVEVTPDP